MDDPTAMPWLAVVILFLIPVGVVAFVGTMTLRRHTPLVFRCQRCRCEFHRRPHRGFPASCPRCRARDWNVGAAPR